MEDNKLGLLAKRLENFIQKKFSLFFGKRIIEYPGRHPLISFTFDDFPRSAYLLGGKILAKYKVRGSYYVSMGSIGSLSPSGEIFHYSDLKQIINEGHEVGCHTFDHLDAWAARDVVFEESIIRNLREIKLLLPGYRFKTFSYPIRQPHPKIKRVAGKYYLCCRGGGQKINKGKIDLNLLKSYFIDKKNREHSGFYKELIRENVKDKGWLIFSTHDISENPSAYGCHPDFFEEIVRLSVDSSAIVLPVVNVYACLIAS